MASTKIQLKDKQARISEYIDRYLYWTKWCDELKVLTRFSTLQTIQLIHSINPYIDQMNL